MIKIIIDATDAPLGRVASLAAKQALLGKDIIITNCNSVIISGDKYAIIQKYKDSRARGGTSLRGPNFPRNPERIVKRAIRGMLQYKQGRGRTALKKVMCYNEIPHEYKDSKKITMPKEFKIKTITLKELSERIWTK